MCSIPCLMGMGTEAKARSVFCGLSTIFVLPSERRSSHMCEKSLYPGGLVENVPQSCAKAGCSA